MNSGTTAVEKEKTTDGHNASKSGSMMNSGTTPVEKGKSTDGNDAEESGSMMNSGTNAVETGSPDGNDAVKSGPMMNSGTNAVETGSTDGHDAVKSGSMMNSGTNAVENVKAKIQNKEGIPDPLLVGNVIIDLARQMGRSHSPVSFGKQPEVDLYQSLGQHPYYVGYPTAYMNQVGYGYSRPEQEQRLAYREDGHIVCNEAGGPSDPLDAGGQGVQGQQRERDAHARFRPEVESTEPTAPPPTYFEI